jgi:hypothetical protein
MNMNRDINNSFSIPAFTFACFAPPREPAVFPKASAQALNSQLGQADRETWLHRTSPVHCQQQKQAGLIASNNVP